MGIRVRCVTGSAALCGASLGAWRKAVTFAPSIVRFQRVSKTFNPVVGTDAGTGVYALSRNSQGESKMNKNRRSAFTLVEVLIVVVIMAVLAATIIPQFSDSSKDAKISTVKFNLSTLRSQVEIYKSQHDGRMPGDDLAELTIKTNVKGTTATSDGALVYGPYIQKLPLNPFTNSSLVKEIAASPAVAGDVTSTDGWLYHKASGGLWINHADYLDQ